MQISLEFNWEDFKRTYQQYLYCINKNKNELRLYPIILNEIWISDYNTQAQKQITSPQKHYQKIYQFFRRKILQGKLQYVQYSNQLLIYAVPNTIHKYKENPKLEVLYLCKPTVMQLYLWDKDISKTFNF